MAAEKQALEAYPGLLNKENRDTKGKALLNKRQSINYKKKRGEKMSEGQKVVSQFHKNSIARKRDRHKERDTFKCRSPT